jgi:hypothetical protein
MRFMILVKANEDSEAGVMPTDEQITEMAEFHEELAKAGVLVAADGLHPTSKGFRIRYDGDRRTVVDGPFTESKELVAGFTTIDVRSREEALEWARRFPCPAPPGKPAEIEVRQVFELDDFVQGEGVERFRRLEASSKHMAD